ncbi:Protein CBG25867 [Caenorhabditis briggsae]|uniref:Protein CBG25867 n=1 Tax=Caenorhabditis briggsae TaxID=6238 RepID=B6IIU4_CAEBR|nr:Protein CBG25867 [Caenorhabditis briggsae]CAR99824.1 Protein CBG25867 [Caenorhabditis briggsae]
MAPPYPTGDSRSFRVPEPEELLSPTQKSSILEAEPTQLSEKEEPKQKKKPLKKTKSRQERSPTKVVSETDQPRTCSPANEKSVYSPKLHPTQEKSLESHVDDADMRTAREDLWN